MGRKKENELKASPLRHKIDFLAFFTVELLWPLYSHGMIQGFSWCSVFGTSYCQGDAIGSSLPKGTTNPREHRAHLGWESYSGGCRPCQVFPCPQTAVGQQSCHIWGRWSGYLGLSGALLQAGKESWQPGHHSKFPGKAVAEINLKNMVGCIIKRCFTLKMGEEGNASWEESPNLGSEFQATLTK